MSDSLQPHGLKSTRFLYPWDFPGKNTRVGFSRGSSQPRDHTWISYIGREILYHWATREAHIIIFFKSSGLETHPKIFDKCMKGIPYVIFQFLCPLITFDLSEWKLKAKQKVSSLTIELVSKKLMYPFMIMFIGSFNTQLSHSPSKILSD